MPRLYPRIAARTSAAGKTSTSRWTPVRGHRGSLARLLHLCRRHSDCCQRFFETGQILNQLLTETSFGLVHRSHDLVRSQQPEPNQRFGPINRPTVDTLTTESFVEVFDDFVGE